MKRATLRVEVPAKINLHLSVLDRRPDGYHELQTLFQSVDVWDRLSAAVDDRLTLTCDDPRLSCGEDNLVLRAAGLLLRSAGKVGVGARIALEKRIPWQAGMGGGSADAAGTLLLLDRLWGLDTPGERLRALARELGADVSYFLEGGSAIGRGRGDRIEPIPYVGDCPVVLLHPPFGVSTPEAFARLKGRLTLPRIGVSLPRLKSVKWPPDKDFGVFVNDLERPVFELRPELETASAALKSAGAGVALLSGSGSTVFGLFEGVSRARQAAGRLARKFPDWKVVLSRFVRGGVRWSGKAEDG